MAEIRHNWTLAELQALHEQPLFALISKAHHLHARFHDPREIQLCTLLSIKTGGCTEDCKYCAQSARNPTSLAPARLLKFEEVMQAARQAKANGATRFCMGAGWREVTDGKAFENILQMIKGVKALGLEVCCTLGMLEKQHAEALKAAGLYAYNHNLDTSERYYPSIVTTRSYQSRLDTLQILEDTGISVCCGGILGLGETAQDRLELLLALCTRNPHPDSVPVNKLCPIPGTPLQHAAPLPIWEMVRIIAIARLCMPKALIRLSAGRKEMSMQEQALCFFAGANSIHLGEKLLTVGNTSVDADAAMFATLGLKPRPAGKRSG